MSVLDILYQDEWLVAVDKPAGMLVHPADKPQSDDLVAMKILRDQLGQHVYTVHRLDRPTTGVLLFALNQDIARNMHRIFEEKRVQKIYHAVVEGEPNLAEWMNDTPIQKDESKPFREARTEFRLLGGWQREGVRFSLLECIPHTGRFHQIRRHLIDVGLPIVGDFRYAGIEKSLALGQLLSTGDEMQLKSVSLRFSHPATEEETFIQLRESAFLRFLP